MNTYVYVLSLCNTISDGLDLCEGVWGVFDTQDKAIKAAEKCIDAYNEQIVDFDADINDYLIFTNETTWKIEKILLNDEPVG